MTTQTVSQLDSYLAIGTVAAFVLFLLIFHVTMNDPMESSMTVIRSSTAEKAANSLIRKWTTIIVPSLYVVWIIFCLIYCKKY
jgi:hypothetical protein